MKRLTDRMAVRHPNDPFAELRKVTPQKTVRIARGSHTFRGLARGNAQAQGLLK